MANQLANQSSPYLQQHKDNPVDWYPWGESALSRAKRENKPIFLSIGYSACHWCHVMAHESFENPQTAQLLNEHFISIKVDREERPDLDDIYMQAVVILTGQGGWPLSVFLTPDLKPFYGGTYFPPIPRHGLPSFNQVLTAVIDTWANQPQSVENNANILTSAILKEQNYQADQPSQTPDLDAIINQLHDAYDWQAGGWGRAPKFPQPMLIEFLIHRAIAGSQQAQKIVVHLLEQMAMGGMYDLVGGGFHRYSTDNNWLIPHFEKMLYDNAQLALAYLHAYALTGKAHFRSITEETLAFIQSEMSHPLGGFFASMDADTAAGEGRYYAWEVDELKNLLSVEEFTDLEKMTGVTNRGNFETGLNVFQIQTEPIPAGETHTKLRGIFQKLKNARDQREAPGKDEKIITEWNAYAIRAIAEAGLLLNRADYREIAKTGARFILENLISPEGRLYRTWRDGKASQPGTLADYAGLIIALQAVYCIDFDPQIYQYIRTIFRTLQKDFASDDNLYFDASTSTTGLIVRPRKLQDNATPSGNALAAYAHWLLGNYEHDPTLLDRAGQMIKQVGTSLQNYPTNFGYWLQVAGIFEQDTKQIALISQEDLSSLEPFLSIYRNQYRPFDIIAAKYVGTSDEDLLPSMLEGRPAIDGNPTAYVCQGFTCRAPTTERNIFEKQLNRTQEL